MTRVNLEQRPKFWLEVILVFPALLYGFAMKIRNLSFDHRIMSVRGPKPAVISVGNLTAGGTGKTPIVSYLLENFESRGWKTGVVSRGYGGEAFGPERVLTNGSLVTARRFGDEPTWLAHRHPKAPIFIGRDRVRAAIALTKAVAQTQPVDLILADDAFQHRRLKRALDIVLIDATQPRWHYRPLPLGRLREGWSSLKRAPFVILTKVNLANAEDLKWIRDQISQVRAKYGFQLFEFEWRLSGYVPLGSPESTNLVDLKNRRILLVSGIARAQAFEDLVQMNRGEAACGHIAFSDHHAYTTADLEFIEAEAARLEAHAIVVTEKDAVKLVDWKPQTPCFVTRLQAIPKGDLGELYAAIGRLVL